MKKKLIIAGMVVLITWLFILPKLNFFLISDGEIFRGIRSMREELTAHYESTGEIPADLSGIQVPDLGIVYTYDADHSNRAHSHWSGDAVDIRPGYIQPLVEFEYGHGSYSEFHVEGDFGDGRDRIPLHRGKEGKWVSGAQPVKPGKLRFWFVADGARVKEVESDINYLAPEQAHVRMVQPDITTGDSGEWVYDPESGLVFFDCSGVDMKHRRHWWKY